MSKGKSRRARRVNQFKKLEGKEFELVLVDGDREVERLNGRIMFVSNAESTNMRELFDAKPGWYFTQPPGRIIRLPLDTKYVNVYAEEKRVTAPSYLAHGQIR